MEARHTAGEMPTRQRWAVRAGIVALVVVVLAPAVASWRGLVETGHAALGLPGGWALLVPLVFDAAAFYSAALSLRAVLSADSALTDRLLVWVYALGSAALNVWHADRIGGRPAALFYGVASVSAVVLWDRTLRAIRRDALRELGAVDPPAPRFRLARWLIRPGETWRAWSVAITEGISMPAEALARVRNDAAELAPAAPVNTSIEGDNHANVQGDREQGARRPVLPGGPDVDRSGSRPGGNVRHAGDRVHPAGAGRTAELPDPDHGQGVAGDLADGSKADAVRAARAALGETATGAAVVDYLAARGVAVKDHYVYDVARRDAKKAAKTNAEPAGLALVAGGE